MRTQTMKKRYSKEDSEIQPLYTKVDGVLQAIATDLDDGRFDSLKAFLQLMMRIPSMSLFSLLQIFADWPNTRCVLTAAQWRMCDRRVKNDANPIPLLVERCREHTNSFPGYFGEELYIYDHYAEEQTTGSELQSELGDDYPLCLLATLTKIAEKRTGLSPNFRPPLTFPLWQRGAKFTKWAGTKVRKTMVLSLLRPIVADWMKSNSAWRKSGGLMHEAAAVESVLLARCGFVDEEVESRLRWFFCSRAQLTAALFTIHRVFIQLDREVEVESWFINE